MSKDKDILNIYNEIEDTHTYIRDSTMKSIISIALYEIEIEKNISLDPNAIVRFLGLNFIEGICKTVRPECFQKLTYILEHYNSNDGFFTTYEMFKEKMYAYFELNIVKKTCVDLDLTYKQLGEAIGVKGESLTTIASTGKISPQTEKTIELFLETISLKKDLEEYNQFKTFIKNIK